MVFSWVARKILTKIDDDDTEILIKSIKEYENHHEAQSVLAVKKYNYIMYKSIPGTRASSFYTLASTRREPTRPDSGH